MIARMRQAAEWLGDLAEKAKAIAAAVTAFTGVVVVATADNQLGLDEIPTLITAGVTLAVVVYAIVWRVPNEGHINLHRVTDRARDSIRGVLKGEE